MLGRSDIPFAEMITLDYLYVTNWSLWGDIKLLARTVPTRRSRSAARTEPRVSGPAARAPTSSSSAPPGATCSNSSDCAAPGGPPRVWVTFDKSDARSLLAGEQVVHAYGPTNRNIPNLLRNLGSPGG